MSSHGTPSYELGQFAKLSSEVTLSLSTALDGIDPKEALKAIAGKGEQFALHTRQFFMPEQSQILRPRSIIRLSQVPVNHDRKWEESIAAAGPSTGADWDVRKVGDLYVAERKGIVLTDMTLVNFGEDVGSEQVVEFGRQWNLGRVIDPRECFAISEHFPTLHKSPAFFDPMAVVSLKHCQFRAKSHVCSVWWGGGKRRCHLAWFDDDWHPNFWFGFVSEL